jgi:acyl dehydratase
MTELRYYEDLEIGTRVESPTSYLVTEEEVREIGERFDPQPFHVDPEAAAASEFGGLIASTVHIFAMDVALGVKATPTAAVAALGFDNMRLLAPVRPGDTLTKVNEVIDRRLSNSRPGVGVVKLRDTLYNQRGEAVFTFENTALIRCRPSDDA